MRKSVVVVSLVLLLTLLMVMTAAAQERPVNGGAPLTATLTGAAEVPGPGHPDGSGSAWLALNQGQGTICYLVEFSGIGNAVASHIHVAPAGSAGGVVVPLTVTDPAGEVSGCADVDPALIKAIRGNPAGYYVNVHTAAFPAGALRGQLSAPVD